MEDPDKTLISRVAEKVARKQREYDGDERRSRPMISDTMKFIVGVALPVIGALIVMYSTQQVVLTTLDSIRATHEKDMAGYREWRREVNDMLRSRP